jgi:hypothetical protein
VFFCVSHSVTGERFDVDGKEGEKTPGGQIRDGGGGTCEEFSIDLLDRQAIRGRHKY